MTNRLLAILGVVVLLVAASCKERIDPMPESRWIRHEPGSDGVIIFVHGFWGSARGTWVNAETTAFWPEIVASDDAFNGYNIFLYEYPTRVFQQSYTIDQLSDNFRLILDQFGVSAEPQLVFLAHSMGGLVVRAYLNKYPAARAKTKMIYFFATPTTGADLSHIVQVFSRNPQAGSLLPIESNEYLQSQQSTWLAAARQIKSFCGYETLDTYGVRVVPQASATNLCTQRLDPIDGDHMSTVKPRDASSLPHRAFRQAFQDTEDVTSTAYNPAKDTTIRAALAEVAEFEDSAVVFAGSCSEAALKRRLPSGQIRAVRTESLMMMIGLRATPQLKLTVRKTAQGAFEVACEH